MRGSIINHAKVEDESSGPPKDTRQPAQEQHRSSGSYLNASDRELIANNDGQALEMAATPSRTKQNVTPTRGQTPSYVGDSDISIHDEGSVA